MGQADYYKHGDRNAICDICGFKVKFSALRKRWDGFYACASTCWEPKHPQESIRAIKEKHPRVTRPEPSDTFLAPGDATVEEL